MSQKQVITVIKGDGIGPEVVEATLRILEAAKAPLEWDFQCAGEAVFKEGNRLGVTTEAIESMKKTNILLKGPLTTPIGFGEQSANVTLRQLFETYANIRPVIPFPNVKTPFKDANINIAIVRENIEGLYTGIEYMQTSSVAQSLKLVSEEGCHQIILTAFEYAKACGQKKVHCATKANIMKLTEGLLKTTFEEISKHYPTIQSEHIIIDNCAHQLVINPEQFGVIVTSNMNGDILSDLTSGLVGGLGLASSCNIGQHYAIFEAVHGSAPTIAGQNKANPTAILGASILMLRHLQHFKIANTIEQALMATLEQGIQTIDLAPKRKAVSTNEFTQSIINNLGTPSKTLKKRTHRSFIIPTPKKKKKKPQKKTVIGIDIFIESTKSTTYISKTLHKLLHTSLLKLHAISNRGTSVYPVEHHPTLGPVNHWRCRLMLRKKDISLSDKLLLDCLQKVSKSFNWMHVEKLLQYNGENAFSYLD